MYRYQTIEHVAEVRNLCRGLRCGVKREAFMQQSRTYQCQLADHLQQGGAQPEHVHHTGAECRHTHHGTCELHLLRLPITCVSHGHVHSVAPALMCREDSAPCSFSKHMYAMRSSIASSLSATCFLKTKRLSDYKRMVFRGVTHVARAGHSSMTARRRSSYCSTSWSCTNARAA